MILKAAALSAIALLTIGASLLWFVSYKRNSALIEQTDAGRPGLRRAAAGTLPARRPWSPTATSTKSCRCSTACATCRPATAPATTSTPLAATYGLSQRERLQSAAENVYHIALERMFRSRMLFRLEEQLDANMNNPGFVYEPLKVYLMLGGQQSADRELIKAWMQRDWTTPLSRRQQRGSRSSALEDHLARHARSRNRRRR